MPERKQYSTSAIPDVKSVYSAVDEITASAICALTILLVGAVLLSCIIH
jgi:hypothetical protein